MRHDAVSERVFQSAAATKTPGIEYIDFLIGCHKKTTRIHARTCFGGKFEL